MTILLDAGQGPGLFAVPGTLWVDTLLSAKDVRRNPPLATA